MEQVYGLVNPNLILGHYDQVVSDKMIDIGLQNGTDQESSVTSLYLVRFLNVTHTKG